MMKPSTPPASSPILVDVSELSDVYFGGDSTRMRFWIRGIRVQTSSLIKFPQTGVVLVVGPNNSGKSTLLRQLHQMAPARDLEPQVLTEVATDQLGTGEDFVAWLRQFGEMHDGRLRTPFGDSLSADEAALGWMKGTAFARSVMRAYLVNYADAHSRKRRIEAVDRREDATDPPPSPIHVLESRRDLELEFSAISQKAFGQSITLDQTGRKLRLRVGSVGPEIVRPTDATACEALKRLPLLSEQGDGMIFMLGGASPHHHAHVPDNHHG